MQTAHSTRRHPWLDDLTTDPDGAVDEMLRGFALLPGLQRASPCDALMAVMGNLPVEAPEWALLDHALCRWLTFQQRDTEASIEAAGGISHFIRETGEALRAAWRLDLPATCGWISDTLPDLLRWADNFETSPAFDLGQMTLLAGAHLQRDRSLHQLWLKVCEDAAGRRLRHRLDVGLLGLARLPDAPPPAPSRDLIVGLARWAAHLPDDDRAKADLKNEWRALRAAFPRQPSFWRGLWQGILEDERYAVHPFSQWLRDIDKDLATTDNKGKKVKLAVELPKNINGTIAGYKKRIDQDGLDEGLWRDMRRLIDQLENYADLTGESYYLVTSCTNIGNIVLGQAPGHALTLARRALIWAPNDGHAWSVRAKALMRLNRPDLARNVLWEGSRRCPEHVAFSSQLALLLNDDETEAVLRRALSMAPNDHATVVELALLLARTGRGAEGVKRLRAAYGSEWGCRYAVLLYNLASLLLAEGDFKAAADACREYRARFDSNSLIAKIERLIAQGPKGQQELLLHLQSDRHDKDCATPLPWDQPDSPLTAETAEQPRLARIGRIATADLLLRQARERTSHDLNSLIAEDPSDSYAHLVKALAEPNYRQTLQGAAGRFGGSLPIQLALADSHERYEQLGRNFSDRQWLIDVVRLSKGNRDDAVLNRLDAWSRTPQRWDGSWEKFLQPQIKAHLDDQPALDLAMLAHDALTQAVDVGWNALPHPAN